MLELTALQWIQLVTGSLLAFSLWAFLIYLLGQLFATTSEELPESYHSVPQAVEPGVTVSEVTAI